MIECTHVYKKYKTGTNALYDINISVEQGEFIYIIGPTGSGKSTLIKLLDGEEVPTKGVVKVVGIDVGSLRASQIPVYRRNIGVVFQDYRLLPTKTVFENITYALEVIKMMVINFFCFHSQCRQNNGNRTDITAAILHLRISARFRIDIS